VAQLRFVQFKRGAIFFQKSGNRLKMRLTGVMKQVPYWRLVGNRQHRKIISRQNDLTLGTCVPLCCDSGKTTSTSDVYGKDILQDLGADSSLCKADKLQCEYISNIRSHGAPEPTLFRSPFSFLFFQSLRREEFASLSLPLEKLIP